VQPWAAGFTNLCEFTGEELVQNLTDGATTGDISFNSSSFKG
jgi:hypothetical protein